MPAVNLCDLHLHFGRYIMNVENPERRHRNSELSSSLGGVKLLRDSCRALIGGLSVSREVIMPGASNGLQRTGLGRGGPAKA